MLIGLIRFYQAVTTHWPATCRYTPSCSQYAIDAIQRHGVLKGIHMALRRVLRCNPWCPGGYDPAPPSKPHQPAT